MPQVQSRDWHWPFWFTVPLYPYGQRRTLRTEVVPGQVWIFDQLQGILYVVVPIRMTVVKLASGGLLVYAPIAPTRECLQLMADLVTAHGDVQYIILPTTSGLEHKVFVGPFARRFPHAQVFVAPHQWSFPLKLPLTWLGLPGQRTYPLPEDSRDTPFGNEFDYAILGPVDLGLGPFEEVAFFHRRSRTLLVTDAIVVVPEDPPAIVQLDPYPLLFHAKDEVKDVVMDSPANRRKGWQRIALYAFYFRPSALDVVDFNVALQEAKHAPDRSRQAYFGVYPFRWKPNWHQSFEALRRGGRLLVAPILQTLILNRDSQATIAWVERVTRWPFERIIPCHLDAPIAANPSQFWEAFAFLQPKPTSHAVLPEADLTLLREIETTLNRRGILPPAK